MKLLRLIVRAGVFLALLLSSSLAAQARPEAQAPTPKLRLHRGTFDAGAVAVASFPAAAAWLAAPAASQYAILQLRGPITLADRAALEGAGVSLLEYLPDYAYLARGTDDQLASAARLPQVYARADFTLADKLAPSLLSAVERGESDLGRVRVVGWPTDAGELALDLHAQAFDAEADATAAQVARWAALESVRWIEPAGGPRLLNDMARSIMQVDPVWQTRSLYGTGQIVAIADSGLDTGDLETLSLDFAGRIAATHVLSEVVVDWGDGHGHGTHVAGSLAGAGALSGAITTTHQYAGSFAGVAPEARLVIQAFEVASDGQIIGLPDDYYGLFGQAYADGARVHSDSWGDSEVELGSYPYGSQRTDQFVWDHPDMTIFLAAGNSGVDGHPIPGSTIPFCLDGDGVIDPDSLNIPATAKNALTVGASESVRASGGLLTGLPWLGLGLCFLAPPIAFDPIADNANGMAAFSSRGPTDDGRIKPDLVAPGTNIVSARSHYPGAGTLYGVHETNPDYAYAAGTSMATPLTAGVGVLAREWLVAEGAANPSAALVKALLLDTTHDMAPGQYGLGATQEITSTRPNSVAGWGRADLGFINAPAPYQLWFDDHADGLSTGQAVTYTATGTRPLQVITDSLPLRVMLVWTDPPASLSAAAQLVNDLDLVVTGPGGVDYFGNGMAGGDRTNNVEGIVVDHPAPGPYTVVVRGVNVPVGSQPYALVTSGPFAVVPVTGGEQFFLPLIHR